MDVSIGILLRLSIIVMFFTLLAGISVVRFTKRKCLTIIPLAIPILFWSDYISMFPYRAFAYMGISVLVYLICICLTYKYNRQQAEGR